MGEKGKRWSQRHPPSEIVLDGDSGQIISAFASDQLIANRSHLYPDRAAPTRRTESIRAVMQSKKAIESDLAQRPFLVETLQVRVQPPVVLPVALCES